MILVIVIALTYKVPQCPELNIARIAGAEHRKTLAQHVAKNDHQNTFAKIARRRFRITVLNAASVANSIHALKQIAASTRRQAAGTAERSRIASGVAI